MLCVTIVLVLRVIENYTNTFSSNIRIIDAWKRESTTQGVDNVVSNAIKSDPYANVVFTWNAPNSISVRGESYFYRLADGRWVPSHPDSTRKIHYSLHLEDRRFTKVQDLNDNLFDLKIYPNPVENYLTVQYEFKYKPTSMQFDLFDIAGRLVKSYPIMDAKQLSFNIDMSQLAQGAYIVRLTADANQVF